MIRLLGTVMVGDVVLIKVRRHAIQERHGEGVGVVIEQFDHAARCHAGLGHVARRPRDVHVAVDIVVQLGLCCRVMLCRLFMARFAGVVHIKHQAALIRADLRQGVARGHIKVVAFAAGAVAYLELALNHDELIL